MSVSVNRSKVETKEDSRSWVQTRNGAAMLCGVSIFGCATENNVPTHVQIDFIGWRDYLNAGAVIPIAWMDELALQWCEERNLMLKVLS